MSCFMVSNETINRVVHLLVGGQIPARDVCESLGAELQQLNAEAVRDRYGDSVGYEAYRWSPRIYSNWQLLKAAQCWQYQASDAHCYADSQIAKRVKRAVLRCMNEIVSSFDQYQNADWDAPENSACCGEDVRVVQSN